MQKSQAQRFQKFKEDWSYPDNVEAELFNLDKITKVPVSVYLGLADWICPYQINFDLAKTIPSLQNLYSVVGGSHNFAKNNKPDYMELLKKELTKTTVDTANVKTVTWDLPVEKPYGSYGSPGWTVADEAGW